MLRSQLGLPGLVFTRLTNGKVRLLCTSLAVSDIFAFSSWLYSMYRSGSLVGINGLLDSSVRFPPKKHLSWVCPDLDSSFVGLARSNPTLRRKAESLKAGEISRDEYDTADSLTRSRYLNVATYTVAPAQVLFLAVSVGILYALNANASIANNSWGLSAVIAFISGLCVLFTLPWFVMEKRRPGQTLPAGMNIFRAGLWQWGRAASHIWKLKQTLLYLIGGSETTLL